MPPQYNRHALLNFVHRAAEAAPFPQSVAATKTMDNPLMQLLPDLTRRAAATTTCASNSNAPGCEKPTSDSSNTTMPIIVGIVVPISLALILFVFLHRRHVKKQRIEDANDRHKSLDFGMDPSDAPMISKKGKSGKAGEPEMAITEKALRRGRGMSMDMDIGNPYLLPPGLQGSRESLHSLSRTVHSQDDRYRPATTFIPNGGSQTPSQSSKRGGDDSSSHTGSSGQGYKQDSMNQNLLRNAQRMSRSLPPTGPISEKSKPFIPEIKAPQTVPGITHHELPANQTGNGRVSNNTDDSRDSMGKPNSGLRSSNNYLGALIHSRSPSIDQKISSPQQPSQPQVSKQSVSRKSPPPSILVTAESPRPPRKQSLQANGTQNTTHGIQQDYFQNITHNTTSEPLLNLSQFDETSTPFYTPGIPKEKSSTLDTPDLDYDQRRMSILRPLPPSDPADNPEQRANRIRSFYKEYFDDSRPAKAYAPAPEVYYEDYGEEFQGDGTVFDPASGQFIVAQAPYQEPITRRAMTPPPRAPPRFQGPARHQPTFSGPQSMPPRSRAYSSASARFGPAGRGPAKPLPPPAALRTLPTPHLLREDTFFQSIEFAPPSSYRERQAGRPDSPRSEMRPYSPQLRAHTPLASAFDELSVMPSPHQLRKSGLFTALDFAPPPRFKNHDGGSDSGSIRSGKSNHSAMSAAQIQNIRAGAYRLSRIPKEMVGTKTDIGNALKPSWDLR